MKTAGIVVLAFALDFLFADPRFIPHPVRLIGAFVSFLEERLYPEDEGEDAGRRQFLSGLLLVVIVCALSLALPALILLACYRIHFVLGFCLETFWCWQCLAAGSLDREARNIRKKLCAEPFDLGEAQRAVGRIVGRDADALDERGIVNAAVESIAESTTDGVVSPLVFMAIGGAPLALMFKAASTMDSMIGYRSERYIKFGKAAARLDDILNFVPARIAALLMVGAASILGFDGRNALRIFLRDSRKHASPNAGQTESVMAGALGIELGGDAVYGGAVERRPKIGDHTRPPRYGDITSARRIMYATSLLAAVTCAALSALV